MPFESDRLKAQERCGRDVKKDKRKLLRLPEVVLGAARGKAGQSAQRQFAARTRKIEGENVSEGCKKKKRKKRNEVMTRRDGVEGRDEIHGIAEVC